MIVPSNLVSASQSIPGLRVQPNFLSARSCQELKNNSLKFRSAITDAVAKESPPFVKALYPLYQGSHDLVSSSRILVQEIPRRLLKAESIQRISEKGHQITAFEGNENIPLLLRSALIGEAILLPEVAALVKNRRVNWNALINTYTDEGKLCNVPRDFEFHQDGNFTGEISLIYNLGAKAILQMRALKKPSEVQEFSVLDNTIVVLSGDAHREYEHRMVTPQDQKHCLHTDYKETIRRISWVMGFREASSTVNQKI